MRKRLLYCLMAWLCSTPVEGQLTRDCGDTASAQDRRLDTLRFFTGDDENDERARAGRWRRLPPDVSNFVLTDPEDCVELVEAINPWIAESYPPPHPFTTGPTWHYLYDIGPYYVVVFGSAKKYTLGWTPMLVLDRTSLAIIAFQLV